MEKNIRIILCVIILFLILAHPSSIFAVSCSAPLSGDFTINGDCSFAGLVNGVDSGVDNENNATLTINSGILTIAPNQSIAFGQIILNGGAIALPIDGSASLMPGTPIWSSDADGDHYAETQVDTPSVSPPNSDFKRRSTIASKTTLDCYDGNPSVFPGQTGFFTTHRGDGSFDYNCDNQITKGHEVCDCSCSNNCSTIPSCFFTIVGNSAACGTVDVAAGYSSCSRNELYGGGCGSCDGIGTTTAVMMCQ